MSVDRTRPQRDAGNTLICVRFIAKVRRRLFRRKEVLDDGGQDSERLLKDMGPGSSRFSGPSLEDEWREELALMARERSGRN